MSNEQDSEDAGRSLSPRIKIRVEGGKLHVTAARSLAAGLMVAIVFALLGSLGLLGLLKNKHGDTKESRILFASFGYVAAIVCIVASFQKEHLVLDPRANRFEHHWDGGLHPRQTLLTGIKGPIVATELRKETFPEHRLRFEDHGVKFDVFVDHDRDGLERLAQEVAHFLEGSRPRRA